MLGVGLEWEARRDGRRGARSGSAEVNTLVERHREVFSAHFPITRQMQLTLVRVYEHDPADAAHYDAARSGLTSWIRRGIAPERARASSARTGEFRASAVLDGWPHVTARGRSDKLSRLRGSAARGRCGARSRARAGPTSPAGRARCRGSPPRSPAPPRGSGRPCCAACAAPR